MTPLEALAHGVPSVLLDTPVAREVYGDAARLVAADPAAIADALRDAADRRRTRATPRAARAAARGCRRSRGRAPRPTVLRARWKRRPRR